MAAQQAFAPQPAYAAPPAAYAAPPAAPSGGADPDGPPVQGRLRPVRVGKTVILSILTLGIYCLVREFKLSGDLHRLPGGDPNWKAWFWLQLVPYAGIVFTLILYWRNSKQADAIGPPLGVQPTKVPFILACIPVANLVAPFLWASHYNDIARRT